MVPSDLKYTKDHTWMRERGPEFGIGITEYGQEQLGDVFFVELPEVGRHVMAGEAVSVVESPSGLMRVQTPRSGVVTAVNSDLRDQPEGVNADPYGEGWLFFIRPDRGAPSYGLIDAATYEELFG
ncbi:glycine cleavage system protein GcvH [Streptomyces spongiicola]|uniref:Glycine cleavage system protein GcvH n=1 Tax=Streptomyces spongiicola TaxID=1690221 RepID=A0A388T557_9ACTN|nr:glycine cleavage system protein GcvH [Streptomyces spongiicola]GBQ04088.1 glycine cleavage system protein GcvH [Streptomyces spongiicola]